MNRFMSGVVFGVAMLLGATSLAQSASPAVDANVAADTVDVQHVMDAYHAAVVGHDGVRLTSLFIPQGSVWLNVLSDAAYARAKAKSPDAVKIRGKCGGFCEAGFDVEGELQPYPYAHGAEQ